MPLLPQHAAQLEASGIPPEVIEERGYRSSESASDLARLGFGRTQTRHPALVVPLRDARGEIVSYQIRPDDPRINHDGNAIRYESPTGAHAMVDVPPRAAPMLSDPQIPLLITEGAKKADAAASLGLCCVNVTGVWSWRGSNGLAGRTALADWEYIALNSGRHVYLVFDSDVTLKREVHAALARLREFLAGRGAVVRIVYLPPGAHAEKCGLDDYLAAGHTAQELLALASDELREVPRDEGEESGEGELPYQVRNGMIWWKQTTQDGGERWRPIARFAARVTRNILEDDGSGQPVSLFEVEARQGGRQITTTLSPEKFEALHWPAELLGAGASIYPGQNVRDHVRFAIRRLSGDPEWHQVYTHTGWRKLPERGWVYLHTDGGIAGEGHVRDVEVRPSLGMERYRLPDAGDVDAQREAVRRSLGMLEVADERAMLPLLAAVYTAPLGELLQTDWVMWLYGESGSRKSTIAALALSHFGQFTRSRLPANFTSTVNAIETMLHAAKDALIVIDDYAPPADRRAREQMDGVVHRLLRAVGDNRGRQRLTADAKLKGEKPARGLPLVTAELRPAGVQSAEARTFEVQLVREAVDLDKLTAAQEQDAPHYARAMAGYLQWLAPQLDALRETLPGWVRTTGRNLAGRSGISHGRVAETGAKLLAGFGAFVGYAAAIEAVTPEEAEALMGRASRAVLAGARRTSGHQAEKRASSIFFNYLQTVLAQRLGYMRDRATNRTPDAEDASQWGYDLRSTSYEGQTTHEVVADVRAEQLGWVDGDYVYLLTLAAHRAVVRYAQTAGQHYPATREDLADALQREGLLVGCDRGRTSARVSIGGTDHRVWRIRRADFLRDPEEEEPPPDLPLPPGAGPPGDNGPELRPLRPLDHASGRSSGRSESVAAVGESGTPTDPTADTTDTLHVGVQSTSEAGECARTPHIYDDDDSCGRIGRSTIQPYSHNGLAPTAPPTAAPSERSERSEGVLPIQVGAALAVPLTVVTAEEQVPGMLAALAAAPLVGLDLETTGLNPRKDRARLISLATGAGTWVVDLATVPAEAVLAPLRSAALVTHNGKFDLGFLMELGFEPGHAADTMLMSQLLHAGQPAPKGTHTLASVAKRWLGVELPKELQKSRWDGVLTQEQIDYAARDAAVLLPLHERLAAAAAEAGIERAVEIEHRALPAIVWMGQAGVPLDREAWVALAGAAAERQAALEAEMNAIAPPPPGLDLGMPWQWGNPAIVKRVFEAMGIEMASTGDEVLAAIEHPLAELVRKHRKEGKLLSTYGESWPEGWADGRIYPDWQQLGAEATGRMSCRGCNVQQMPRQDGYRQCVVAPPGRMLVTADYSQIELRIAATVAGERKMLAAYQAGEDLHKLTASVLLGKSMEAVTKQDRQLAKSCFSGDTEILTPAGWVRFDEYDGVTPVAQYHLPEGLSYNPSRAPGNRWHGAAKRPWKGHGGGIEFAQPIAFKSYDDREVLHHEDRSTDLLLTGDHDVIYIDNNGRPRKTPAADVIGGNARYLVAAGTHPHGMRAGAAETRLLAMVVADGSFSSGNTIRLGFSKGRKVERCRSVLRACGIVYREHTYGRVTHFAFANEAARRWLLRYTTEKKDLRWECLLDLNGEIYLDEAAHWDGWQIPSGRKRVGFTTTRKQTADVMQAMAALSGIPSVQRVERDYPGAAEALYGLSYRLEDAPVWRSSWDLQPAGRMRVYCVQVPSGAILIRRNGKVCVMGNCNFGLLYGMGAPSYQVYAWTNYGVRLTPQQATHYRALFLMELYPGLQAWHERVRREHAPEARTLAGRRRVFSGADADTKRLNTPVQGTGADGLKRALGLLWERRDECPGAVPIIACHDEIVVECPAEDAEAARDWVWCAMMDGIRNLIAPVPVEVEPVIGARWEK